MEPLGTAALIGAGVVILIAFLLVHLVFSAFSMVGLRAGEVAMVLLIAPWVRHVHIPLFELDGVLLAINLAGAVIPLLLVTRFLATGRAPMWRTTLAAIAVGFVAHEASRAVDGQGIMIAIWPTILAAAVATTVVTGARPGRTGPVAYSAGTLGTLVGADILRLRELGPAAGGEPMMASIGGAGTGDAIFVVALMAVLVEIIAVVVLRLLGRKAQADRG